VTRRSLTILVGVWAAWSICLLGFQELVVARLHPDRPDHVLSWTAQETGVRRFGGRPYLAEPLLNSHVAFDSEYYLSIATVGYDDPDVPQYQPPVGEDVPLNYAFMPAYPAAMRVVAAPLGLLGLEPVAAAAVAGVAVSLASALAAMFAVFSLARRHLGEVGGLRAAFYLLVFPTGFFLAQVYTEALFLALAFGSIALAADRRPVLAGLLAIVAVLTRPVGVALALPLAIGLVEVLLRRREAGQAPFIGRELAAWAAATAAPLVAFLAWSASPMGRAFDTVQREYFGRGTLNLEAAWRGWSNAVSGFGTALPETRVYYALEAAAVLLALVACAWAIRRWPAAAAFGLAVLVISVTSGEPQSLVRYVLAVPPIFLLLGRLGAHPVFDRGWTILSVLGLGLLTALYSVDFWVA
jgi:Mannosyltransferase (PIG-V)